MPRRSTYAILIAAVLATSCSATSNTRATTAGAQKGSPPVTASSSPCPAALVAKTLYLVAGRDPFNSGLYRRGSCAARASRVGAGSRYSYISTSSAVVAVTAAEEQVDRVYALRGERLGELEGAGAPIGFTGTATTGGSVAWVEVGATAGDPFAVKASRAGKTRTIFTSHSNIVGLTVSGAVDRFAIAVQDKGRTTLVRVDGSGRLLDKRLLVAPGVRGFAGSEAHDLLALSGPPEAPGVIIDLTDETRRTPIAPGWRPLVWSPDGRYLLMSRGRDLRLYDRNTAGMILLPAGDLNVYSAAWVP